MPDPFLTLPLHNKRDLLRAMQVARQAADLFGFQGVDQLSFPAAVFDLACQAHAWTGRATACFEIIDASLRVVCMPTARTRDRGAEGFPSSELRKQLPAVNSIPREDVPWMLKKLVELSPLDAFEEIRKVNQGLLQTLLELAQYTAGQRAADRDQRKPLSA